MSEKNKIRLIIGLAAIGSIVLMWFVGLVLFCNHIRNFQYDNLRKTDAIIVLTGGRNRITEGVRLLNNHMAERLFISGVSHDVTIADIETRAQMHADEPIKIELGYKATNTIENASEIAEWIKKNDIKSVRWVTSNYHIPRSMEELKPYNLSIDVIINPVYSDFVKDDWWKSWGTFKFLTSEYHKFLFVYIRNLFR
ncbi:MAG: YdcF family protein [Alphaproteobacteria bacterium]|nr:YdcF family protein [Alphaproteobacteria bacterium]